MPAFDYDTIRETARHVLSDVDRPLVACLCAAWCGSCRDYAAVFNALAERHPEYCFVWVDVEDHSDRVDAFEVENFPSIVIEDSVGVRFNGPVLPHAGVLSRLLAERDGLPVIADAPSLRDALSEA
ncbi:thioredoxin family protein [Chitinasiproducens palmae]|uniref:Thiol-disulfide isomerase or thioredoxin n=1 Tax=Chitinasiproducens palmae TaxID=1770053 RepID=A0A1H2PT12_9BURK|nr:thioredoxin family protein [Chitinasiproducens palmae]SDV50230.1 Thiol-disulfide isomerase or thioredoxin [Chitinasiproducens palmae]